MSRRERKGEFVGGPQSFSGWLVNQSRRNQLTKKQVKKLPNQMIGPCKETQGADVAETISDANDAARNAAIRAAVDRFLSWPLPKSVCSDTCVTMNDYKSPRYGTNLLSADEARQMFEYVLSSASEPETKP